MIRAINSEDSPHLPGGLTASALLCAAPSQEIYALEIQMYTEMKDNVNLKRLYERVSLPRRRPFRLSLSPPFRCPCRLPLPLSLSPAFRRLSPLWFCRSSCLRVTCAGAPDQVGHPAPAHHRADPRVRRQDAHGRAQVVRPKDSLDGTNEMMQRDDAKPLSNLPSPTEPKR